MLNTVKILLVSVNVSPQTALCCSGRLYTIRSQTITCFGFYVFNRKTSSAPPLEVDSTSLQDSMENWSDVLFKTGTNQIFCQSSFDDIQKEKGSFPNRLQLSLFLLNEWSSRFSLSFLSLLPFLSFLSPPFSIYPSSVCPSIIVLFFCFKIRFCCFKLFYDHFDVYVFLNVSFYLFVVV